MHVSNGFDTFLADVRHAYFQADSLKFTYVTCAMLASRPDSLPGQAVYECVIAQKVVIPLQFSANG